jgi:hypothetical protein
MDVMDAACHLADDYPGGAAALAVRMGKSPSTLQKELRGELGYKLGLKDSVKMSKFAGSTLIATAYAAEMGGTFLLLPDPDHAKDCPLEAVGALSQQVGLYIGKVSADFSDGDISDNERQGITERLADLMVSIQRLQAIVIARNEASRQPGERRRVQRRAADRQASAKGA